MLAWMAGKSAKPPLLTQSIALRAVHIESLPLNPLTRLAVGAASVVLAIRDPTRADAVAMVGETTGVRALKRIRDRMAADEVGARILADRPVLNNETLNVQRLLTLPEDTLGGSYARFMDSHGYTADGRPPVRLVQNEELAFVLARYRGVHDFWHVLSGLPTTVAGELAVKWLEFAVTGLPLAGLSAASAPLLSASLLPETDSHKLHTQWIPWALRTGSSATDLMCVYYEERLEEKLDDVRSDLGLAPAP